ncbi:MAG: hypothetical protein U0790_00980 [Isosphaeraceae bacterium]
MNSFRLPFPKDPEHRRSILDHARSKLDGHGSLEGTAESGTITVKLPIVGAIVGSYASPAGVETIEFTLKHRPFLVPLHKIRDEIAKILREAPQPPTIGSERQP